MLLIDQEPGKQPFIAFLRHGLKAVIIVAVMPVTTAGTLALAGDNRTYDMEKVTPYEFRGDVRDLQRPPLKAITPSQPYVRPVLKPPYTEKTSVQPVAPELPSIDFNINAPLAPMPAPTQNFGGLNFSDICAGGPCGWPPDPNGDVGPNHYIQAVNTAYAIYSKTGSLLASFSEDFLWKSVSTSIPCNGNSWGDPIVLYDQLADRWILTHFAFMIDAQGNPIPPFYECIAVSKTSDPVSGGWWLYPLHMDPGGTGPPVGTMNDYPKFGIWTDCLYMSANEFSAASGLFAGTVYSSMSRSDLEGGGALTWSLGYLNNTTTPFSMIPSNLLGSAVGSLPPLNTPNYFVSESATGFNFEVRKFTAGPNCGGGGTLSAPEIVSQTSYASTPRNTNIVPQPGTANKLDMIDDRLMQKVQYRNIGGVESLWVVHNVLTSPTGPVALQWAQIDVTNGTIATTPVQQQIHKPDTSLYRWMGSLAVDKNGNMALGYSTSGKVSPNYPSIAYSGRLATDPTGTLPQTEVELVAGAGSQTVKNGNAFVSRWGDYTAMSVDPADDCTFWYTNQYYSSPANGASGNWQTRIGSFKFPLIVDTTTITGIVLGSASGGGNVTNDGCAAVTDRGVCWSISANPTTADTCTHDGAGTGIFASSLTGLTPGTLYHVRSYAVNSTGTVYGNEVSFTSEIIRPKPPTGVTVN
jgi:hypothetical protein